MWLLGPYDTELSALASPVLGSEYRAFSLCPKAQHTIDSNKYLVRE